MKFGISLLLWTDHVTNNMLPLLYSLKSMGYDSVEIPIFHFNITHYKKLGGMLDEIQLSRTAVTARTKNDNPISNSKKIRDLGLEHNKRSIDCCHALGASLLGGIYHSAFNVLSGRSRTDQEWEWSIECMKQSACYAASKNILLSVEFVNRFENYLINNTEEALRYVNEVGYSNCGILYDTYHAHIEENNIKAALQSCNNKINHIQISENNRGTPGSGLVNWSDTFESIRTFNPNLCLTVEAFSEQVIPLVPLTKMWHPAVQNRELLAKNALMFMKKSLENQGC